MLFRSNESPKYPTGYVYSLDDGYRSGEEGKPITFAQDWFALGQIIFDKCYKLSATYHHESVPPHVRKFISESPNQFDDDLDDFEKLSSVSFTDEVSKMNDKVASFLCDYLTNASEGLMSHGKDNDGNDKIGYKFKLRRSFRRSLEDCNLIQKEQNCDLKQTEQKKREDSKIATGSPPKKG